MKRVFLVCVGVVFLFGISSVSFADGMKGEMKGKTGTMKEDGMKKGDEAVGDMKGKEEEIEMSTGVKSKDMPDKIEGQGKEKMGKTKKKPMKEEPMKK